MRMFNSWAVLTSITGRAKSLQRCRKGAAATELALILPLLTTMILAVFEYGTVIYSYSMMQFGANRVARTIAVNRMTTAQAQVDVRAYFPGWVRNDVTVSVTQSNVANVNTNLVQVQLSVPADQATPLAILTRLVPWQLSASVTMKQELPYVDD